MRFLGKGVVWLRDLELLSRPVNVEEQSVKQTGMGPWRVQGSGTLLGHTGTVRNVALTADGKTLASGGEDGRIRLWTPSETGWRAGATLAGQGPVTSMALAADGQTLPATENRMAIRLWRRSKDAWIKGPLLEGHTQWISQIAFAPEGSTLVSVAGWMTQATPGEVKRWDVTSGKELEPLAVEHTHWLESVAVGRGFLVLGNGNGLVQVRDLPGGKVLQTLPGHVGPIYALSLDAAGKTLASTDNSDQIQLWRLDGQMWQPSRKVAGMPGELVRKPLALSADGQLLAAGGPRHEVHLWDVAAGKLVAILYGHRGPIESLAFRADGTTLVSASQDNMIKVWTIVR
jgi:WD40 repeat protein